MTDFEDEARAEAERQNPYSRQYATDRLLVDGFVSGALWAVKQDSTDAEVEAAALALHEIGCADDECDGSDLGGHESDARAALLAAQKARQS